MYAQFILPSSDAVNKARRTPIDLSNIALYGTPRIRYADMFAEPFAANQIIDHTRGEWPSSSFSSDDFGLTYMWIPVWFFYYHFPGLKRTLIQGTVMPQSSSEKRIDLFSEGSQILE